MEKINLRDIRKILQETFPKSKVPENIENLKINDLSDWDSLGNFNLLLAIEARYSFKFTLDEISKIKSIPQILSILKKR